MRHFFGVVNYLSHFLLTEKLLQQQNKGSTPAPKFLHVTSSFHFAVDGSDLYSTEGEDPVASLPGGNRGFYFFRSQRQYANSKLAQILHSRYLSRQKEGVSSVTACPAWVGTQIIQTREESWPSKLFHSMALPAKGYGLASILSAMFSIEDDDGNTDGREEDDDFYINTSLMKGGSHLDSMLANYSRLSYSWLPIRDTILFVGSMIILQWQRVFTEVTTTTSSRVSYDEDLQTSLYEWSYNAVKEWL
jgi:hypothetical protein